jgi:hypothetical protein
MSEQAPPPKPVRRKKEQVRRFEPRTGVSQRMVDDEARYVAREVEDYCLLSLNDLKQKLADLRIAWKQAHDSLEEKVRLLDTREQAALQCLLARDCHHLFALYLSFVVSKIQSGDAPSRLASAVEEEAPQLRIPSPRVCGVFLQGKSLLWHSCLEVRLADRRLIK